MFVVTFLVIVVVLDGLVIVAVIVFDGVILAALLVAVIGNPFVVVVKLVIIVSFCSTDVLVFN